ncbi:MAG: hypothetical protein R3280_14605 [Marinobacter sp.]|uniref:hypothetical protein n=1 Tax=Marinobacter sp. TaxID=50741 RepID=UPI00299D128E|nr:hypothetical protein [Marinobacter sp.]MDX1635867.1 hypothetical protein [Marinobacter sp.]
MSHRLCRHCGHSATESVKRCPECGRPLAPNFPRRTGALLVVAAAAAIIVTAVMVVIRDDPATPSNGTTTVEPLPTQEDQDGSGGY